MTTVMAASKTAGRRHPPLFRRAERRLQCTKAEVLDGRPIRCRVLSFGTFELQGFTKPVEFQDRFDDFERGRVEVGFAEVVWFETVAHDVTSARIQLQNVAGD